MKIYSLIAAPILFISGCAEPISPEQMRLANQVRTATPELVQSCQFVGPVNTFAAGMLGGVGTAVQDARMATSKAGGTHLVIISAVTTDTTYGHGRVIGEAYKC